MLVLPVTSLLPVARGESLRFDDGRLYGAALQLGGTWVHLGGVMRPTAGGA